MSKKLAKNNKVFNQKGVSLLLTFFIMIITLSAVVSVSSFVYTQLKIVKNLGYSVVSFYSAYSGVEKVLYYDKRSICKMYGYSTTANPQGCPDLQKDQGALPEESLYCNAQALPEILNPANPNGCRPEVCNSCRIRFTTNFGQGIYQVTASTAVGIDGLVDLQIESRGSFEKSSRQIKIFSTNDIR